MAGRSSLRGGSRLRALTAALAAPTVATAFALLLQRERSLGAVSVLLLGVVVAAALGGLWSGIVSSVIGFLSLNYFFTEPQHTLRVTHQEDVVALVTFLVVAVVVGSLLARALQERARAERREFESRLLVSFTTKVLSGERLDRVLGDFAEVLLDPLRLVRCEIRAHVGERAYEEIRERRSSEAGGAEVAIPLVVGGQELGTLTAVRVVGLDPLGGDDLALLEAAARHVALSLERAQLDADIAGARLEAETNQVRAALFSSVTHDLRTPLASIKAGVTGLLQEDAVMGDEQRVELLKTVLQETDRLNRLVGNLLDLSRIRAGALVPAKEPTAIDEVVESVLHRMQPQLAGVKVRTIMRDPPEVPADPMQLDQVVTNVLENAVRFSPPGGEVLVSVGPWRSAVQVRIADHGPGIPLQDRERVFEVFYRGDASQRGGSGLGLAIARAIVLAHGGRIWVEGSPSGGAAVVFELPAADTEPVPQETGT